MRSKRRRPNQKVYQRLYWKSAQRLAWTTEEIQTLKRLWQTSSLAQRKKLLPGRAPWAVRQFATKELGLEVGQPQGTSALRPLAVELGYTVPYLRKILVWAGSPPRTFNYTTGKHRSRWMVDTDDAHDAVRQWEDEAWKIEQAAVELKVNPTRLRRWLVEDGLYEETPRGRLYNWRALPHVYRAVVEGRRPEPDTVSALAAAKSLKEPRTTLERAAHHAGFRQVPLGDGDAWGLRLTLREWSIALRFVRECLGTLVQRSRGAKRRARGA